MYPLLHHELESHPGGATLYLRGALSVVGALRAFDACGRLPARVRALRVDMRGVELFDPSALDTVSLLLHDWRTRRGGMTRIHLPRERTFVSLAGGPVGLRVPRRARELRVGAAVGAAAQPRAE